MGHESGQYDVAKSIAGLLFKFTLVKIKGPNKTFKTSKKTVEGEGGGELNGLMAVICTV